MKILTMRIFLAILGLLMFANMAQSQTVKIIGQVRERTELDNRSFSQNPHLDPFHLLRSRLGGAITFNDHLGAMVELQDARTFGASRTVLNSGATSLDMRQGWIELRGLFDSTLTLRVGRQVLAYGNERLVGASDWGNFGQSFDGLVAKTTIGSVTLDGIAAAIARNPATPVYTRDVFLAGLWGGWKTAGGPADPTVTIQGFFLFDNPRFDSVRQNRHTVGVHSIGALSGIDYEVDGAYQFGDFFAGAAHRDIAATLVGVRLGYTMKEAMGLRIGAGLDMLSGKGTDSTKHQVFNTLYATNHKFYGHMDILDNAAQRGDMGLRDLIIQASVATSATTKIAADLHLLSLASNPDDLGISGGTATIGKELDLTFTAKLFDAFTLQAGWSLFDGDGDRLVIRGRKTVSWGFVSGTVSF
ncbi:MAG: alginate export family protein [Chlorobi bacterium]|nr:alginate export family protein [Chlorobiota bacterium]MBX7217060.1 alginate export family protein [Candidatus Kapabacteria bacterium]